VRKHLIDRNAIPDLLSNIMDQNNPLPSAHNNAIQVESAFRDRWNRFWFQPTDPTALGAIRLCTGLILLYAYLSCAPHILSFVGPHGWVDSKAIGELRSSAWSESSPSPAIARRWWGQSIWFYVEDSRLIWILYGLFIVAIGCFAIGYLSRTANVVVWIGHLSFVNRSYLTAYGFDVVVAMLTFYLLFGPTGRALAIDALIHRAQGVLQWKRPASSSQAPAPSWSANAVIRLIQVHMCIIYLCSGLAKLQGESWWNGTAIWRVMMAEDLVRFDLRWLARLGDSGVALIFEPLAAATVLFEVSFAFLIWNRLLRPFVLIGAVFLHGGIGLLMGLDGFSAVMLTGCLAFVPPEIVRRLIDRHLKPRFRLSRTNSIANTGSLAGARRR
jgi:hypothetical protein